MKTTVAAWLPLPWQRLWVFRILPAILMAAIASVVTSFHIDRPAAWRDEAATLFAANRSIPDLWRLVQTVDIVHALYYLLIHGWIYLVGDSYTALRILSVISVAVATGIVVIVGSRLGGLAAGLASAGIFMMIPPVTWAATEARSYALVTALSAVTLWAFLAAQRRNTWARWIVFGLVALVLTTMFLFASLALAAIPIVLVIRRDRQRLIRGMTVLIAAGLLSLPLLTEALSQTNQVSWLAKFDTTMVGVASAEAWWGPVPRIFAIGCSIAALGIMILIVTARHPHAQRTTALLVTWLIVPTLTLLVLTAQGVPSYYPRYVAVSWPALALVIGVGLARIPWPFHVAGTLIIMMACSPMLLEARRPAAKGIGWYAIAQVVKENRQPGDAALYQHGPEYRRVALCFPQVFDGIDDLTMGESPAASATLYGTSAPMPEVQERSRKFHRIWLIGDATVSGSNEAKMLLGLGFKPTSVARTDSGVRVVLMQK